MIFKTNDSKILNLNSKEPELIRALFASYGKLYALIGIWKIVWGIFTWLGAYWFLKVSLVWLDEIRIGTSTEGTGHAYAVALLICGLLSSVAIHQLYAQCARVGIQVGFSF